MTPRTSARTRLAGLWRVAVLAVVVLNVAVGLVYSVLQLRHSADGHRQARIDLAQLDTAVTTWAMTGDPDGVADVERLLGLVRGSVDAEESPALTQDVEELVARVDGAPTADEVAALREVTARMSAAEGAAATTAGRLADAETGLLVLMTLVVTGVVSRRVSVARAEGDQRAAAERERGQAHFRALVENSSDVIVAVDAERRVTYASPSAEVVLGVTTASDLQAVRDLVVADDRVLVWGTTDRVLDGEVRQARVAARFHRRGGGVVWLETTLTDLRDDPAVGAVVLNAHDVTGARELEHQLRHQAFHDQLTGLANRALFTDRLAHLLARGTSGRGGPAVLAVDLDGFKTVNDTAGHLAGDEVLRTTADVLREVVRDRDTPARLGGDEFAVVLEDTPPGLDAEIVAERLVQALSARGVSASVGVALVDEPGLSRAELLRDADTAMYAAKAAGGRRATVFDPSLRASLALRRRLRRDLPGAVDRGELVLHHQPIVDLATGAVTGLEALVRWDHPALGLLPPGDFVALAEETGDIVGIGRWVLRQACLQRAGWLDDARLPAAMTMAVNVSARQLDAGALVADVRAALDESGLDARLLVVEVTESELLEGRTGATQLHQLRDLGVGVAVDDFGTGYSSLSYLQTLPIDVLKIDRSFVQAMTGSAESLRLVEGIVTMARALGLALVAEGVEEVRQVAALRALGCGSGQGYLWARPTPADQLPARLVALAAGQRRVGEPARLGVLPSQQVG